MSLATALAAALIERVIGYPKWLLRAIGHPVMWIGALIGWADTRFNTPDAPMRRWRGTVLVLALIAVTLAVTVPLTLALRVLPFGWLAEAVLATSMLAQKELRRAVAAVAGALGCGLPEARAAVSHIVGRDTAPLDEAGVARAAVETLAESSSDGVIAPLFWLALLGLPGAAVYKAINTADSMIGHKDTRYAAFGWAAARLDDLLNLVPARLTAMLVALAALVLPGADAGAAIRIALRDAKKHESPNAGWPEAAVAGALGLKLGGPRSYGGELVDLPAFGDGRADIGAEDIVRALALYDRVLVCAWGVVGVGVLIWWL